MVKWKFWEKTVGDMSVDQLETERIKQQTEEKRRISQIESKEEKKKELFKQGAKESSIMKQAVIARQMKKLDADVKSLMGEQGILSKRIRLLNRLIRIKRNEAKLKEKGVWNAIKKMSAEELDTYVIRAKTDTEREKEILKNLLEVLEESPEECGLLDMEKDEREILKSFAEARETGNVDETFAELEKKKKKREKIGEEA